MFDWKVTLVALIAFSGICNGQSPKSDPKGEEILTKLGEYKPLDGKLSLKISTKDGKLAVATTPSATPWQTVTLCLPNKKEALWLVFPEVTADGMKVWFFLEPDLVAVEFTEQRTGIHGPTASVLKEAPKAVIDALPKEVRERLKGK